MGWGRGGRRHSTSPIPGTEPPGASCLTLRRGPIDTSREARSDAQPRGPSPARPAEAKGETLPDRKDSDIFWHRDGRGWGAAGEQEVPTCHERGTSSAACVTACRTPGSATHKLVNGCASPAAHSTGSSWEIARTSTRPSPRSTPTRREGGPMCSAAPASRVAAPAPSATTSRPGHTAAAESDSWPPSGPRTFRHGPASGCGSGTPLARRSPPPTCGTGRCAARSIGGSPRWCSMSRRMPRRSRSG
jgi:hypothetical protein